ncbi:MAG: hypothetical protein RIB60_03970 [Phycisphaerales bacterium]
METESKNRSSVVAALLVAGCLAVMGVSLTGCNAVEGLGEDLQESSHNVRDAASGDND